MLFLPLKCFSLDKGFENGSGGQVWWLEEGRVFHLPHLILLCSVSECIFYLSHHQVIQISTAVQSHIVCQLMQALTKPRRHFSGCSGPKPEQTTKSLPVPCTPCSSLGPARPFGFQFPLPSIKPEGICSKIISLHLMEGKGRTRPELGIFTRLLYCRHELRWVNGLREEWGGSTSGLLNGQLGPRQDVQFPTPFL